MRRSRTLFALMTAIPLLLGANGAALALYGDSDHTSRPGPMTNPNVGMMPYVGGGSGGGGSSQHQLPLTGASCQRATNWGQPITYSHGQMFSEQRDCDCSIVTTLYQCFEGNINVISGPAYCTPSSGCGNPM